MRLRCIVSIGALVVAGCSDGTGVGRLDGSWRRIAPAQPGMYLVLATQGGAVTGSGSWYTPAGGGQFSVTGTVDDGWIVLDLTPNQSWGPIPSPSPGHFEGRQASPDYLMGTLVMNGQTSAAEFQSCPNCVLID